VTFAVAGGRPHGCNGLLTNVNASISTLSDGYWQKGERNAFTINYSVSNPRQRHLGAFNVGSYTDVTETKNVFFVVDFFVFFSFTFFLQLRATVRTVGLLHKTEKLLDERKVLRENTTSNK